MSLFSKPKIRHSFRRSDIDNSIPSYEEVLIEVEKRMKEKEEKKKDNKKRK